MFLRYEASCAPVMSFCIESAHLMHPDHLRCCVSSTATLPVSQTKSKSQTMSDCHLVQRLIQDQLSALYSHIQVPADHNKLGSTSPRQAVVFHRCQVHIHH